MLYVADLRRDNLLKVGVTARFDENRRRTELRRTLNAPKLQYVVTTRVPSGWGAETVWEKRLLAALRRNCGTLQLYSAAERSEEVVDASKADAYRELQKLRAETYVDMEAHALDLNPNKEDWRFGGFMENVFPEARYPSCGNYWANALYRQLFLYWIRGEPVFRGQREAYSLSCAEVS